MAGTTSTSSSGDQGIQRILRAANHFDMLLLPRPHPDLMDQPVWEVTGEQVHKAFRKLSLCCHPDKSTHPDAPRAFEALKKAKAVLANELDRDDYLLSFVRHQKTSWEGNWASVDTASEAKQRVSTMREAAQREESDSVADAMRERREKAEAAERKKQRLQAAKQRRDARRGSDNDAAGIDDDDDEDPAIGSSGVGVDSSGPQRPESWQQRRGSGIGGAGATGGARKKPKFL